MRRRTVLLTLLTPGVTGLLQPSMLHSQPALLELNQASRAELESLTGLGPALVERVLAARSQAPFKDWADLQRRVRGIGAATATKLSAQGLRVAGLAYGAPSGEAGK